MSLSTAASSPSFIIQNGLRKVIPYHHTNSLFVKGRWFGKSIVEVLKHEFKSRDEKHYLNEIQSERIFIVRKDEMLIKDKVISTELQNKDVVSLTIHKHEPFVIYQDRIPVIYQDDNMIVVNKPSSIPVHPTGKYYYNSLTEMLKAQLEIDQIHPCHRLDKLTSGVLVLAKSSSIASEIQKQILEKSVEKYYLARVQGKFPSDESLICNEPISNLDTKIGYENSIKQKKPASTKFRMLKYSESLDQSIVLCSPLTGRTHQIRIHLNFLGHPIINDPLYGPQCSPIRKKFIMNGSFVEKYGLTRERFDVLHAEFMSNLESLKTGNHCEECGEVEFHDPNLEDLQLYLHAFRYKFDKYEFEAEEPSWADI